MPVPDFHSAEFFGKGSARLREDEFSLLVQQLGDLGLQGFLCFVLT